MSANKFKSLLYKSSKLHAEILKEQKRPKPDWLKLVRMKKIRLSMKDRMLDIAQQYRSLYNLVEYAPVKVKVMSHNDYTQRRMR